MKSALTILLLILFSLVGKAQKKLLPVAKNGKWGLVDTAGNFILHQTYDYLEYFPLANKYIYRLREKKGVVNSDGTLFSKPIYENVILFDSTWMATQKHGKWDLSANNIQHFDHQFDSISSVSNSTFLIYLNGEGKLFQGNFQKVSERSFQKAFPFNEDLILAQNKKGTYTIYHQEKEGILAEEIDTLLNIGFNYSKLIKNQQQQLIDLKSQRIVGDQMDEITYQFGRLFYCILNGKNYLFSGTNEKTFSVPALDKVIDYTSPFVQFEKEGKQGVWNRSTSQLIIPPKYEALQRIEEGYLIHHYNRYGVISRTGKIIIPINYQSIDIHNNVYVVLENGNYGVLSKRGEEVIPREYEKIKVYDNNIKCYSPSAITIIKLDESGAYKSQKTYDEYMSISIEKERLPRQRSTETIFGGPSSMTKNEGRYGWFRPVLTRMVKDSLIEFRGRWGIRDTADSVIVRPQYAAIKINDKSGFTKAYHKNPYTVTNANLRGAIQRGWSFPLSKSTAGIYQPPFQLMDNASRKPANKKKFFALNLRDFNEYYLARGFDGGPVLITPDGSPVWKNLRFYGDYSEDILRVCQEGKIQLTASVNENTICEVKTFFNNTGAVRNKTTIPENYMEIDGGNWFYLSKTGEQLNAEPYEMAEEFRQGLAIVKQNGKWGVIDTAMSVIIPFEHSRIKRVILKGKSYFEVNNTVQENYLYSRSNGQLASTEIHTIRHYSSGNWFVQKKGSLQWALMDTNLTELTAFEFDQVYPFQNGHATVVKRGKKTLIDTEGQVILPFYKCKRIETLGFDRYGLIGSRGTMVINITGDTLLSEKECKAVITSTADYLIYEVRGKQMRFLNFKNEIQLPKESLILSYSLKDDLFLIQKNGKKRLFSMHTGKFVSSHLPNVLSIGEGSMIYRGKNGLLGYLSFEGDTLSQPQFKELEPINNGWAYARLEKAHGLVDINGNYLFDYPIYRVKPLEENYSIITKDGMGIMDSKGQIIIPPGYMKIEPYNSVFYKAQKENLSYDLYTKNGKKVNDKVYQQISAISPDALIVRHKGFDYLYNGFLNKSVSFQSISPISGQLYLLKERRHIGMFNSEGELIIPIRYHKVEPAQDHFEVSFFNSFGHFSPEGKALGDPYNGK